MFYGPSFICVRSGKGRRKTANLEAATEAFAHRRDTSSSMMMTMTTALGLSLPGAIVVIQYGVSSSFNVTPYNRHKSSIIILSFIVSLKFSVHRSSPHATRLTSDTPLPYLFHISATSLPHRCHFPAIPQRHLCHISPTSVIERRTGFRSI